MSTTPVHLGPAVIQFQSFSSWVNRAQHAWQAIGVRSDDTICLDAKGRMCRMGRDFMIARDEGAFPVTVYLKRADLEQYQHLNNPEEPEQERDTRTQDMFGGGA